MSEGFIEDGFSELSRYAGPGIPPGIGPGIPPGPAPGFAPEVSPEFCEGPVSPIFAGGPNFLVQLARFIGETVTVFVTAGGEAGCGVSGILLQVTPEYITLSTRIAMAPSCALGNACGGPCGNRCYKGGAFPLARAPFGPGRSPLGSISNIPVDRIASFVHNTV